MSFNVRLAKDTFGLTAEEVAIFRKLSTPIKIQDYLDTLAINFEKKGHTNMSPRTVIREQKAHCFEGAMLAALALWLHSGLHAGPKEGKDNCGPLILDMRVPMTGPGEGHCLALYKRDGLWGAISKTNHAALRFRDPVYASVRELLMSYFHENWDDATGKKLLRGYAGPFDLRKYKPQHFDIGKQKFWGTDWATSDNDCDMLERDIRYAPSVDLFPKNKTAKILRNLRKPDKFEKITGTMTEWKREDPRT